MIRVKSGYHDSTFFKVFQVYQIVLLFRRRARLSIKYIFHQISSHFTRWQYITSEVTLYLELNQNQSNIGIFLIFSRIRNIERSFEQAKSFCQVLVLDG